MSAGGVELILGLAPGDPRALRELADAVSEPGGPRDGLHLDRAALAQLLSAGGEHMALLRWLAEHGLHVVSPATPGLPLRVRGEVAALRAALGAPALRVLLSPGTSSWAGRELLPPRWAGQLHGMHLMPEGPGQWLRPLALAHTATSAGAAGARGIVPDELRARYAFPADWDASGETIAVMALGGALDLGDLEACWAAWGVAAPELHVVQVGPGDPPAVDPLQRLETTMVVSWLAATAPGARIVVYYIDPALHPDPWVSFMQAVVGDSERRPTIATTSWSAPELQYMRMHGREAFAALLDQATVLGITVLAASGDWGALGGLPPVYAGRRICGAPWPTAVFPASEARVLAVGGTMLADDDPRRDVAWNAPLLPALRAGLGFERFASGGGFSQLVPIPAWQREALARPFALAPEGPAVLATGRGYPDVALLAFGFAGTDPQRPAGGFATVVAGRWRDDAGGTSLAAPIWAAVIAGLNHIRRARGHGRLGCVQPRLYPLGSLAGGGLREVCEGHSALPVAVVGSDGAIVRHLVPGYHAGPGWNPVTGLGVPCVAELVQRLALGDEPTR